AARAGGGSGDGARLDEPERARLRRQAREWLDAERGAGAALVESGKQDAVAAVARGLGYWRQDPAPAGVRDKDALEKLPAEEGAAWRKLWAEVDALHRKAAGD